MYGDHCSTMKKRGNLENMDGFHYFAWGSNEHNTYLHGFPCFFIVEQ